MEFLAATQSNWFLIGWIAKLLGYLMNWIFEGLNWIGIPNIGLAIILFTLVIKALMIPMSIKQQKYSKLQAFMAPELKAIQEKYKGKTDQASMMAQQEETKAVYDKYGTSATGGCLQLIIQMPILFALYQVIYKLPGYIGRLKELYGGIADKLTAIEGWAENKELIALGQSNSVATKAEKVIEAFKGDAARDHVIDMMYNFEPKEWETFRNLFNNGSLNEAYEKAAGTISQYTNFLGIDLTMSCWTQVTEGIWWAIFIPLLAGGLQFLSTKLAQAGQPQQKDDPNNPLGSSMKLMNYLFPLMSVVFCFMFQAGLGVYWVASSGVQLLIQIFVNMYLNKVDLNEMVKKNVEKANVKRIKRGQKPIKVQNIDFSVKNIQENKIVEEQRKDVLKKRAEVSTEYYETHRTAKKGSLAEKAGMVQQYEEKMKDQKSGKKK